MTSGSKFVTCAADLAVHFVLVTTLRYNVQACMHAEEKND